ncbi:MAG: glycerophosphodiester phosphodiesterase [Acidimicrobiales bacterium]|nr:glycerophosphodiester phosphodiesterase [Acidimicrobiales bacterium]
MPQRLPSLLFPPVGFAHRGARAHAPENTLEAFELALRLGATGLESDVWLTADGEAVLDHDGVVGSLLRGRRRKPIGSIERSILPHHIPTLAELYEHCGTDFQLSLDVKDPEAVHEVIGAARDAGSRAATRLWLCHPDLEVVSSWRDADADVRLVNSARLADIKEGPERRAATLAERDIDAVNMHHTDWTGGLVTMFHRFGRFALGWDAQFERMVGELVEMGIDGVFSDHVDRMMDTIHERTSF